MRFQILLLAAMLLLPTRQTSRGESHNIERDGNWWIGQEDAVKNIYLQGLMAGVELGGYISLVSLSKQPEKFSCQRDVRASYLGYIKKYVVNVTVQQIQDGLDTFYSDYRNRRIMVHNGVWVVLNSIAGIPEDELNKMIEDFRKNAYIYN